MAVSKVAMVLGITALLVGCGGSSQRSPQKSGACEYDGKSYDDGASFKASDGCNNCTCEAGEASCTLLGCVDGCVYEGKEYAVGASFASVDACNLCSCGADGLVACTDKACVSCDDIASQYADLIEQAKVCDPTQPHQCTLKVVESPVCGCEAFANLNSYDSVAAQSLLVAYGECGQDVVCGPCNVAASSRCSPEGVCVTDNEPTEGVACRVGNEVYPNGAEGVPDPTSCNVCSCSDGQLICDDADCPKPCPAQTQRATSCAECGPTDACLVVETGCFPSCTDTCASGFCRAGACVTVCG
jgi:hypothetical protein